jgi:putative MFS transporter
VLLATGYLGQLAGAFLFSWMAERYGRVRAAWVAVAIIAAMSLGCALSNNFATLLVCRLLQGIGIGGEMPVAATYINELSPARGRGKFFLLYEMIFPIGLMATGQVASRLVPAFGWRSIFLIGVVPCVVIAMLLARLPESPRWLISRGRINEAEKIVREIELSAGLKPAETATVSVKANETRWAELLSSFYRRRTWVVWTLWTCAYFVANSLNNWMPTLYSSVYHLPLGESLRAASLTNVAQVALLLVCAFTIDRIGRRNWTAASFAAGALLLGFLGFSGAHSVSMVMVLATLSYGVVGSANAVLYLYTPEIYPTRMRALGTGAATAWLRIASGIGPLLVGALVDTNGVGSVFLMFGAVSVIGIFAAMKMIETRGQRLEQIAP